jgi:hypothetical protein
VKSIVLKSSDTLFATNEENLYKSTDTAATWVKVSAVDISGIPFDAKTVYDAINNILYIGNQSASGIYKSIDTGLIKYNRDGSGITGTVLVLML